MNICDFMKELEKAGYVADKNDARTYYKRMDDHLPDCQTNDKSPVFIIDFYSYDEYYAWDISIKAEANINEWISFSFYGLKLERIHILDILEAKLQQAWVTVNLTSIAEIDEKEWE